MNRITRFASLICCTLASAHGGDFASPGYSASAASYLSIPLHAASAALSGAVVAWRPRATGIQYNPSLLDAVQGYEFTATYSILSLDRKHFGAMACGPIGDYMAIGILSDNFMVDKIEGRDQSGMLTQEFGMQENSITVAAAGRVVGNISLGLAGRYIYERLDDGKANGMGFDVGGTWEALPYLCVGVSVQNIASWVWWNIGELREPVLTQGRLGAILNLLDTTFVAGLDFSKADGQPVEASIGAQATLFKVLSLRAGMTSSFDYREFTGDVPEWTVGVGIRYLKFGLDYACVIPTSELGLIHRFSLFAAFLPEK